MHELAICQALITQVETIARSHQASAVICIKVAIGPLSGIEADLVERAFAIAKIGSFAANATLIITKMPIQVQCPECRQITEVLPNKLICGHCGNWRTQIISGNELLLLQLELAQT